MALEALLVKQDQELDLIDRMVEAGARDGVTGQVRRPLLSTLA